MQVHLTAVYCSTMAGFFRGALDPLSFELCTELSFPMSPSVSGTVLTVWVHFLMIVMLSLPTEFLNKIMMIAMAATMVVCFMLVLAVGEDYHRLQVPSAS